MEKDKINKTHKIHVTFIKKLYILFLFAYFIFQPFYIFSSGLPQIADYVMLLLIFILFLSNKTIKVDRRWRKFFFSNIFFVMYVIVVNLIWCILLNEDISMIRTASFYLYNFIIVINILILYSEIREYLYKTIFYSIVISVLLQLSLYFLGVGKIYSYRQVIFFNNPNQLAYFSLLSMAIMVLLSKKVNAKPIILIIAILSSYILILISYSRAAIISGAVILSGLIFSMFFKYNKAQKKVGILLLFIIGILLIYTIKSEAFISNLFYQSIKNRIFSIEQSKGSTIVGRGYDRIIKYPQYLIFGAAEGGLDRFDTRIEMHSSLGTILFSYGIIGFTLFSLILLQVVRKQTFINKVLIISILLYGMTHQGIRQPMFWMLICLLFLDKKNKSLIN